jgi:hypothetical protein
MTKNRSLPALLLLGLSLVFLAACSGGGADMSGPEAAGGTAREVPAEEEAFSEGGDRDGGAGDQPGANRTLVTVRSVIKTGEVSLTRADLGAARRELGTLVDGLDGFVDSESTRHDRRGDVAYVTAVVRVPVSSFDAAMSGIRQLGRERHSDTRSKDVTREVIDVDERVETLQNSLNRLQDFQSDAEDIDDLIRFEDQITQRESELQSLRAQQAYLADQTSMSTITVEMSTPERSVPPPDGLDDAGFLSGLGDGWSALKSSVVVVLTVVGAVLPFLAVLALLGIPAWMLLRSRRPGPAVPAETGPAE